MLSSFAGHNTRSEMEQEPGKPVIRGDAASALAALRALRLREQLQPGLDLAPTR